MGDINRFAASGQGCTSFAQQEITNEIEAAQMTGDCAAGSLPRLCEPEMEQLREAEAGCSQVPAGLLETRHKRVAGGDPLQVTHCFFP